MSILAVVPARYASSRLPGKPLADLGGRPVVRWVYEAAASCASFDAVVVATDSGEIAAAVDAFGGDVELTAAHHRTGTDRVAEVAGRRADFDVVVNVQGDQPFVTAAMLTTLVEPYLDGRMPQMTTLACPLTDDGTAQDPNVVKVVCDVSARALYFSRSAIPYPAGPNARERLHHLGLYAFTRDTVLRFPTLPPTPLEQQELLEQLRALEHGIEIVVQRTHTSILEINTADDLERARRLVAHGFPGDDEQ